ncbi:proteasome subunit beta type-7-like [Scleropages formosus]|uniref:Proteasome subunit beta n=1 Tax=Scleropages formosus TaxID=113540 RepID=A0A0P7TJ49_SCLFO|nr:proteasome subunit beta type-7-like [Scleropages formosus]
MAGQEKVSTPNPLKTGTTIAGMVFKDGVVLGADTRATSSEVVANKLCSKIHFIAENIYCCGAGTAADTQKTTDLLASNLAIFTLNSGRKPRVVMAVQIIQDLLFRYQGQIGANLLVGGVDCTGIHLYETGPYGDMDKLESAKTLIRDAIHAGIMSDLGSGNNIDMCVITRQGAEYIRPYQESAYKDKRKRKYKYIPGTTAVLKERAIPLEIELVQETVQFMDTA